MRGTTIARVAAEAGVGVGTVSRVLNGSPSVSEATRRRVLEAIAALDYEPSADRPRALDRPHRTRSACVAPFFTQPSVIERLRGVSPAARRRGLPADPASTSSAPSSARDAVPLARRARRHRRPAGDLARARRPTEARRLAARRASRSCCVDRAHDALPCVTIDDVEGGRLADRAPARARPPADRLRRRRRRTNLVRLRLQRAPARRLRGARSATPACRSRRSSIMRRAARPRRRARSPRRAAGAGRAADGDLRRLRPAGARRARGGRRRLGVARARTSSR